MSHLCLRKPAERLPRIMARRALMTLPLTVRKRGGGLLSSGSSDKTCLQRKRFASIVPTYSWRRLVEFVDTRRDAT